MALWPCLAGWGFLGREELHTWASHLSHLGQPWNPMCFHPQPLPSRIPGRREDPPVAIQGRRPARQSWPQRGDCRGCGGSGEGEETHIRLASEIQAGGGGADEENNGSAIPTLVARVLPAAAEDVLSSLCTTGAFLMPVNWC